MRPRGVVRALLAEDRPWLRTELEARWGGVDQARAGALHDVGALPGFVALTAGRRQGFATYGQLGATAELAVIDAGRSGGGLGTLLLEAVVDAASHRGATELWAVTTNDNVDALRFYQRRSFRIRAVRPGAADEARRHLKATIPVIGRHGIEVHDEIDLFRTLARGRGRGQLSSADAAPDQARGLRISRSISSGSGS